MRKYAWVPIELCFTHVDPMVTDALPPFRLDLCDTVLHE